MKCYYIVIGTATFAVALLTMDSVSWLVSEILVGFVLLCMVCMYLCDKEESK